MWPWMKACILRPQTNSLPQSLIPQPLPERGVLHVEERVGHTRGVQQTDLALWHRATWDHGESQLQCNSVRVASRSLPGSLGFTAWLVPPESSAGA